MLWMTLYKSFNNIVTCIVTHITKQKKKYQLRHVDSDGLCLTINDRKFSSVIWTFRKTVQIVSSHSTEVSHSKDQLSPQQRVHDIWATFNGLIDTLSRQIIVIIVKWHRANSAGSPTMLRTFCSVIWHTTRATPAETFRRLTHCSNFLRFMNFNRLGNFHNFNIAQSPSRPSINVAAGS